LFFDWCKNVQKKAILLLLGILISSTEPKFGEPIRSCMKPAAWFMLYCLLDAIPFVMMFGFLYVDFIK
jgi:hypothetical protein